LSELPKLRQIHRRYANPFLMSWEEFLWIHDSNVLTWMGETTATTYQSTINVFTKLTKPKKLSDVTTGRITTFATKLRENGSPATTIARHLRHLKAILNWSTEQGYLKAMPKFKMPRVPKGMRGRPITTEEFERMLCAVGEALFPDPKEKPTPTEQQKLDQRRQPVLDSYRFYLQGLWASGLRLTESLTPSWDSSPDAIVVEMSGRRPMLRVPAEAEKGKTHRVLPMAPEFAVLLSSVPESKRRGRVFRLLTLDGQSLKPTRHNVGPRLSAIGKAASVVTDERKKNGKVVKEFASAHDLRRAFGTRWARKVMPAVLKDLMRHKDISTTMQHYVDLDAESTADELWSVFGATCGATCEAEEKRDSETPSFLEYRRGDLNPHDLAVTRF